MDSTTAKELYPQPLELKIQLSLCNPTSHWLSFLICEMRTQCDNPYKARCLKYGKNSVNGNYFCIICQSSQLAIIYKIQLLIDNSVTNELFEYTFK